jgi:chorismate mutase
MREQANYYIVEGGALPEIFRRVAEAKRLLETGEVETVNEAVRKIGISRSAFYKYRDTVRPFNDMLSGRIITFQAILRDEPGVLSAILSVFAASGANILTINQSIPSNGCAAVTVAAATSGMHETPEELLHRMREQKGVLRFEILAG